MVAIKSLAVLLFAAAVSASPIAGKDNAEDSSVKCGNRGQSLYCCNDAGDAKVTGDYTGFLDNTKVKCNSVAPNAPAVNGVSSQNTCSAKSACCYTEAEQKGLVNVLVGCVAIGGVN